MVFDLLHQLGFERRRVAGDPERAVVHVAAGPAGDLADFFRPQGAQHQPVEFVPRGKGDMIDIHVDAHADGIGGNHEIDFARLVERDLRVARARG